MAEMIVLFCFVWLYCYIYMLGYKGFFSVDSLE